MARRRKTRKVENNIGKLIKSELDNACGSCVVGGIHYDIQATREMNIGEAHYLLTFTQTKGTIRRLATSTKIPF